jgi:peptidoglycan hydrolase-like protein with peptidoglycan-binding domain
MFPLKLGSKGEKVKELQRAIISLDKNALKPYGADGVFGRLTESAVMRFTGRNIVKNQSELDNIKDKSRNTNNNSSNPIDPLVIAPKDKITISVQKNAQTPISGSVVRISDSKTKDTYISGVTDEKGTFESPITKILDGNKLKSNLLISVTSTGYESKSINLNNSLVPQLYIIKLKEKIAEDDEIVIIAPKPKDKPKDKPTDNNTNTETPTERLPTKTPQPNKSKKWLYVGLGAAALGLAVFVIIKATKSTTI